MSQPRFWIAAVIVAAAIAPSPVRADGKNEIRAVTFEDDAGTTRVHVRGAQTPTFTVYKLERPSRVVIDVPQARLAEPLRGHEGAAVLAANTWAVSTIAAQELDDGGLVVRVIVTLARPGRYDVKADGNELVVMVMARDPAPRMASAEALAVAQVEREQAKQLAQAAEQGRAQAEGASAAARAEAAKTKAEAERALREARVEAERVQARVAAVQADAAKARQDAAREIEEAARTKTQGQAAKQEVARTKAEAETTKAEAETAKAEAARIKAQVIAAKDDAARARAEATVAQADAAKLKDDNARVHADASRARGEADVAKAEAARMRSEAEAARKDAEAAQAQAAADKRAAEVARAGAEKLLRAAKQQVATLDQKAQAAQALEDKARAASAAAEAREAAAREVAMQATTARREAEAVVQAAVAARDRATHQAGANRDKAITDARAAEARLAQARQATEAAEHHRAAAEAAAMTAKRELENTRTTLSTVEQQRAAAEVAASQAAHRRGEAEAAASDAARRRGEAEAAAAEAAKQRTAAELAAKQAVQRRGQAEAQRAVAEQQRATAEAVARTAKLAADAADHQRTIAAVQPTGSTATPAPAAPGKAGVPVQLASSTATQPVGRPPARASATQAPAAQAPAAQPAGKLANGTPPGQVHDIAFTGDDVTGHITIALTGDATVTIGNVTPAAAELIIDHAQLAPKLERKLDVSRFGGPVRAVSSFRDRKTPDRVRVIAELASPATPSFDREAGGIRWNFVGADIAKRPVTARPGLVRTQHVPARVVGGFGAASTPIAQQSVAQLPPQGSRRRVYHGQTVELHFKDAPIHDLLRIIADTGKVNIVVPDTVDAKVTLDLKRVPWDQALEVILSSHQLWYRREGNLYRIAPRKELDKEDEEEAARREAQLKAESPRSQLVPLNYSSATELAKKLEPMLSPHGKIAVDERTNQLIVTDVSGNREQIARLALSLDTQTPQISIEARIVEARSTFLRQIGVQWGGRALAGAAGGNATGLVWPSSITVAGGNEDAQTNRGGILAAPSDFAVNLPAATGSGEGGALGLSLGSVAGNFNINLRLSALEDAGTVRIISAPKITVANNKQASIASGVSIPISTISANGTQTQFVQADLRLDVTPTVSQRDCTISMNLVVQKNEPDFVNVGARGDPTILRKEAHTYMLVADGETSVLGGIYTRNSGLAYKKIPLLGDLPVLGWLFKNRRENDDRTEILVFITPKITNRALLSCK